MNESNQNDRTPSQNDQPHAAEFNERDQSVADRSKQQQRMEEIVWELVKTIEQPEPLPDGLVSPVQEEETPDLYSLFTALTALRQEVALQGRSFSRLDQSIERLISYFETMHAVNENVLKLNDNLHHVQSSIESISSQALSEMREIGREEGRKEQFDSLIDPLMDTHDQTRRLVDTYSKRLKQNKGLLQWFGHRGELEDTLQAQIICETKLRQKLESLGITPIAQIEMKFDAKTMKAIDVDTQSDKPPHTVIEIYRQGYKTDQRILRFAEVKVTGSSDSGA